MHSRTTFQREPARMTTFVIHLRWSSAQSNIHAAGCQLIYLYPASLINLCCASLCLAWIITFPNVYVSISCGSVSSTQVSCSALNTRLILLREPRPRWQTGEERARLNGWSPYLVATSCVLCLQRANKLGFISSIAFRIFAFHGAVSILCTTSDDFELHFFCTDFVSFFLFLRK